MIEKKAAFTIGRMWADNNSSKFTDSLVQLSIYEQSKLPPDKYIHYVKGGVSWHELGRNQMVEDTLGEFLFTLDTDHTFAPDILERLMRLKKKYKAEVISAAYQYKFPPHNPVANMWQDIEVKHHETGELIKQSKVMPILDWDRSVECMDVGSCGAGAMLIDTNVFKRIEEELGEKPFQLIPGLSEDYSFAFRCKKLGIRIWWCPNVEAHHMIPTVLSLRDYDGKRDII